MKRGAHEDWQQGAGGKQFGAPCSMAIKVLFSIKEASIVLGRGGATSKEIGMVTGTKLHLSNRSELYPGTVLQELTIKGANSECCLAALSRMYAVLIQECGCLAGGDAPEEVGDGGARCNLVVPRKTAAALIGKGGETVRKIREQTGLAVHIEENAIGVGDVAEQIVTLKGTADGVLSILPLVAEKISQFSGEPWFNQWATTSFAGAGPPAPGAFALAAGEGKGKGGPVKGKGGRDKGGAGKGGGSGGWDMVSYDDSSGWGKAVDKGSAYDKGGKAPYKAFDKGSAFEKGAAYDQAGKAAGKAAARVALGGKAAGGPSEFGASAGFEGLDEGMFTQSVEALGAAVQGLPLHLADPRNKTLMISFNCPRECVSALIGKQGAGTKEISAGTDTVISIREIEGNLTQKLITVSGNAVGIAVAYIHLVGRIGILQETGSLPGAEGGAGLSNLASDGSMDGINFDPCNPFATLA